MGERTVTLLGIAAGKGARCPGAERGPHALRARGLVQHLTAQGFEVEDLGDIPGVYETRGAAAPAVNYLPVVLQVNRHTHACVLGTRRTAPDAFLLVVGGDHSLAIGTLAGLCESCRRLGLIWIDAHGDFNTPRTSPSGNIHGMSLAVACGHGHVELRSIAGRDPLVDEADVYLLGPRALDPSEWELLTRSRVNWLATDGWRQRGIVPTALAAADALWQRCDHVHLSFDIDVLDAALVPGTGTPVPGGLELAEARDLLDALGQQGQIHSAEFVEYNPSRDVDGRTAALTIDLIAALLGAS